ncbi:MAG: protein kinase [Deltaproteobacteria bacterium]|nr:protein kinase [Deltaproteobacteria bacterium]
MVLVVDDDAAIRTLVARRLEHAGYRTMVADNGDKALATLKQEIVDLVVLDVMMPGLDGYQVLEQVRARHTSTSLPVIMLTARDKGDDVVRALRLGANDYAIKPVDFAVLLKRMQVHLALRGGRSHSVGAYRLSKRIGAGGMGVVYAAVDTRTDRHVALKVLPRSLTIDESYVRRFMREAALAERVDHPNVVRLLDAGHDGETYYIAMELVEGKNLGELVVSTPLPVRKALAIALQMVAGLSSLKAAGVLHRDIKPENVIVSQTGVAKITDFGIARDAVAAGRMTESGVGVGSVMYASPEQIQGRGDYRSDLYSLGCTLFFMLTAKDPFPTDQPVATVFERKGQRPPKVRALLRTIPVAVEQLVARLMEPDPDRRFQRYEDIAAEIRACEGGKGKGHGMPSAAHLVAIGATVGALSLLLWLLFRYG